MNSPRRESIDERLIEALARGATHADAARAAGVSERTVRRSLQEPDFVARVRARQAEIIAEDNGRLVGHLDAATDTLVELLGPGEAGGTRLRAAVALRREVHTVALLDQLGGRIEQLEALTVELRAALADENTQ